VIKGRNFGWQPGPGYDESPPMTNHALFPNAVDAVWSSGNPTIATSGADFIVGSQWGPWNGSIAVAALAGEQLKVFTVNSSGVLTNQFTPPELDNTFGRLRTPVMGPDGALYVSTANGGNDKILRIVPQT
jgi:glucose/arabinose dehydrogenase